MLPNLKSVISSFAVPVTLHTTIISIVNHRHQETETNTTINAVVQPQNKEQLNKDKVDYSLEYILIHSIVEIGINDSITNNGTKYKCFEKGNWRAYGFFEVVMEEVK